MDFGGNWRLLHYTMQKTYAPFLIVATSQDDSSEIWAVSDINQPITGWCSATCEQQQPTTQLGHPPGHVMMSCPVAKQKAV